MGVNLVHLAEFKTSSETGDLLQTSTLGSGVAVVFYCAQKTLAGLLHIGLPNSTIVRKIEVAKMPGMYADTGISMALDVMNELGWQEREGLVVKIAGGAEVLGATLTFNIGRRVVQGVKDALSDRGIVPTAEDVGGLVNRVLSIDVASGSVLISVPGRDQWEL